MPTYNIKNLDKYRKGKSNVDSGAWVSSNIHTKKKKH